MRWPHSMGRKNLKNLGPIKLSSRVLGDVIVADWSRQGCDSGPVSGSQPPTVTEGKC